MATERLIVFAAASIAEMAWHLPSASAIIPRIFHVHFSGFENTIVESLKPLLLFVVLGGVGYGVYVALNQAPPPEPPSRVAPRWNKQTPAAGKTTRSRNAAATARPAPTTTSTPAASPLASGSSLPFGIGKTAAQPSAQMQRSPAAGA